MLAAIKILRVTQSNHWKERILSWMDLILLARTPLQSAPWLLSGLATACLQFSLVGGVQLVLQRHRRTTSMENLQLVRLMAKVDRGLIKFTLLNCNTLI